MLTGGLIGSPTVKTGESKVDNTNRNLDNIKSVLKDYITNGEDIASQISIYVNNKEKLNCYAVDKNRLPNYDEKSLQTIFSSTKNISALLIAIAVNKKWINSYNDNVNKYWPQFPTQTRYFTVKKNAKSGKKEMIFSPEMQEKHLKIYDVLRHEAVLDILWGEDKIIHLKSCNLDKIRNLIEASKLTYREYDENVPKSERFYHGLTRGFILNEIFRRVEPKNRSMNQYFNEQIAPVLSLNDNSFKIFLKGKPKVDNSKIYHIENSNIIWVIYHLVIPFITNSVFHLPKLNYFNKYLIEIQYSNFAKFKWFTEINQLPKDYKSIWCPEWENAMGKTKSTSMLFENEDDILMEWMSATGITNAHSMSKLLSYYLFNDDEKEIDFEETLKQIIAKPKKAFDVSMLSMTQFTQGGFNKIELFDIVWYLWGGLGGSIYAFSPEYKCVYSYTVIGNNRTNLSLDCDPKKQVIGHEARAKVLFYYLSQYLKSL